VQPLWEAAWRFLKKLKIELPYDTAIPLLGISPKESKSPSYSDAYTPMFIVALFTIPKLGNQSLWQRMVNMLYIYTMEFYPAIKKHKIIALSGKWMELELTMSCEISQSHKDKYHIPCSVIQPQDLSALSGSFIYCQGLL
jgi:hypothetical protein